MTKNLDSPGIFVGAPGTLRSTISLSGQGVPVGGNHCLSCFNIKQPDMYLLTSLCYCQIYFRVTALCT